MIKEIPGLTANESLVYTTLLNLKEGGGTKISEKSGLFRTLVYDILTKLIEKGLVSYVKKEGKRIYRASSPNRILELIQEKEESAKKILPELKDLFEKPQEEVLVEQYEGANGMKSIIEDMFEEVLSGKTKQVFFLGPTGESWNFLEAYFIHSIGKIKKLKLLKKVDFRIIWSSELKTKKLIQLLGNKKMHRILPKGFASSVPFIVYGDKFVINGGETKPFVVLIKNKGTADSFKHYFEFIWERLSS